MLDMSKDTPNKCLRRIGILKCDVVGDRAVTIDVHVEGARLVLKIADDGKGFDALLESEGQGLASMKRRAERLSGAIQIASQIGFGTTITVSAPI